MIEHARAACLTAYRRRSVRPMPDAPRPNNRARAIRVEDDLWQRAMQRARERDETLSDAIRKFLERYAR